MALARAASHARQRLSAARHARIPDGPGRARRFPEGADPRAARPGSRHRGRLASSARRCLPFGAVVLAEVLRAGKPRSVSISALGLREGLLYLEAFGRRSRRTDPLLSAARELTLLRSRSPAHGEELIPWTAAGAWRRSASRRATEEKRLRAAACLLADIGWRAHPDYRGEQSLNIISNAAFVGIDHPGPRLSGARDLLPPRRADGRGARRRAPRACAAALPRERAGARRCVPRRLSRLRRGGGRAAADEDAADGQTASSWCCRPSSPTLRGARLESRLRQFAALGGLLRRGRRREAELLGRDRATARSRPTATTPRRDIDSARSPRFSASACSPKSWRRQPCSAAHRRGRRRRSAPDPRCSR